ANFNLPTSPFTATFNHTTAGLNRALLVSIAQGDGNRTINLVTYGGETLTAGPTLRNTGGNVRAAIYYLLNPALGSNPVQVTLSGNGDHLAIGAVSYNGVLDIGAATTVQGIGTSLSGTLVTNQANSWIAAMIASN